MFQRGWGDWKQYRSMFGLSKCDEIDLHFGERDRSVPYREVMAEVRGIIEGGLSDFMRSKAATSLIERKHCIQHETVFVAKVRQTRG